MSPSPIDRIRDLSIHDGDEELAGLKHFRYEWWGQGDGSGFEDLSMDGINYSGVYHPFDGYCKGNPCAYCGRVTSYD